MSNFPEYGEATWMPEAKTAQLNELMNYQELIKSDEFDSFMEYYADTDVTIEIPDFVLFGKCLPQEMQKDFMFLDNTEVTDFVATLHKQNRSDQEDQKSGWFLGCNFQVNAKNYSVAASEEGFTVRSYENGVPQEYTYNRCLYQEFMMGLVHSLSEDFNAEEDWANIINTQDAPEDYILDALTVLTTYNGRLELRQTTPVLVKDAHTAVALQLIQNLNAKSAMPRYLFNAHIYQAIRDETLDCGFYLFTNFEERSDLKAHITQKLFNQPVSSLQFGPPQYVDFPEIIDPNRQLWQAVSQNIHQEVTDLIKRQSA